MAVSYDQIYKEELNKAIGDSVTRLQQSQEQQEKALKAGYDQQQTALADNRNKALREAYISKMKEERDMPSAMARQGLNGGMVESNVASINRAYQNNRRAAEDNFANNKTTLDVGYEGDLANIRSQYVDAIATARQNANSLALSNAGTRYNALVAEEEKKKAEEEARKAEEEAKKAEEEARKKEEQEKALAAAAAASSGSSGSGSKSSGSSGSSSGSGSTSGSSGSTNNGSALANQSGLAGTSGTAGTLKNQSGKSSTSGNTQSANYKSYNYVEKTINGHKYIYKYGVKNNNQQVLLSTSRVK